MLLMWVPCSHQGMHYNSRPYHCMCYEQFEWVVVMVVVVVVGGGGAQYVPLTAQACVWVCGCVCVCVCVLISECAPTRKAYSTRGNP